MKPQAAGAVSAAAGNHPEAFKVCAFFVCKIQVLNLVVVQTNLREGLRTGYDCPLEAHLNQVWYRTGVILMGMGQKQVIDALSLVWGDAWIWNRIGIQNSAVKHHKPFVVGFQQKAAPAMFPVAAFKYQFCHRRIIDQALWTDIPAALCSDWMCAGT